MKDIVVTIEDSGGDFLTISSPPWGGTYFQHFSRLANARKEQALRRRLGQRCDIFVRLALPKRLPRGQVVWKAKSKKR